MPTNRRRRRPAYIGLTEEMVEAWRAGDRNRLNQLCGIRPWQFSPLDTVPSTPPPSPADATLAALPNSTDGWARARMLRQQLMDICAPGRVKAPWEAHSAPLAGAEPPGVGT